MWFCVNGLGLDLSDPSIVFKEYIVAYSLFANIVTALSLICIDLMLTACLIAVVE